MRELFDPSARSVLVSVEVWGGSQSHTFRFAIDTGATQTLFSAECARLMGYDPERPAGRKRIRSATGSAFVPLFRLTRIEALGRTREDFVIAAQDFPVGVEADGLLGLDFFRQFILKLDFARGRVSLTSPSWWRFWQ